MLDQLNHSNSHFIKDGVHLSYNKEQAIVDISENDPSFDKSWHTYKKLFFEHSDTCPSRKYRERMESGL